MNVRCGGVLTDTPTELWEHRGGALSLRGGRDASLGPDGREVAVYVLRSGSTALEGNWCFGCFESLSVSHTDCHSFQISIPLSVKGRIIMETIEGMRYLHGEGVIHKDLKPENILVDSDFHIKVNLRQGFWGMGAILILSVKSFWTRRVPRAEPAQLLPGDGALPGDGERETWRRWLTSFTPLLTCPFKNPFPFENSVHCSQRKKREGFLLSSRHSVTSGRLWQQESQPSTRG